MNPVKPNSPCQVVDLESLLFGDDSSAEYRTSASHVEMCPDCQERLRQLAADDTQWAAAKDCLRAVVEADSAESVTIVSRPRSVKLDFLKPPSHPEMLGRLGRYEIERVIGAGGMGIVLKAFDTELNRPVAIKVLSPHLSHSAAARQRFAREARAAASIVHEHVVSIHDVDAQQDAPFLVMQYVGGQSLAERVEENGPLLPEEVLRIGIQAAAGLAAAHSQGVIHRDVKPANILLENGVDRAMLTDFGLARAADDATLTHSGIIAGTPHYMSPEQARGEAVDARSDLFSLGSVMYFMATGHPPFRAEQAMAVLHRVCMDQHRNVQELNPAIPDELADAIDRLLEKKPGRRFESADDVRQSLERALVRMRQPRRMSVGRWLRRHRRLRRPLAAAICLGLLAVAIFGWYWKQPVTGESLSLDEIGEITSPGGSNFFGELGELEALVRQYESRYGSTSSATRDSAWDQELGRIDSQLDRLERMNQR